jgi:hypothetical protein
MITRRFRKGGRVRSLEYPDSSEWHVRWYRVGEGGEPGEVSTDILTVPSSVIARSDATAQASRWLAEGWQEIGTAPRGSATVQDVRELRSEMDEERLRERARRVAGDLPSAPDWATVWEGLKQHAVNVSVRRKLLTLVQASYRERVDEAERLARLEAEAALERARAGAVQTEAQRRAAMVAALASQATVATDGQRRVDFEE